MCVIFSRHETRAWRNKNQNYLERPRQVLSLSCVVCVVKSFKNEGYTICLPTITDEDDQHEEYRT